jgi:branched-subunit amino acid transport protein
MSATWTGILLTCAGCYALKLVGVSVPDRVLEHPWTRRTVDLIPVALLGALVAVQVLADGRALAVDARVAALGVAAALLVLRVPFLGVVAAAALTAAVLRL